MAARIPVRRVEPRKLPSRAGSSARVEKILKTTRDLICRSGLESLTTNQIARAARIPVGSVYQYFPNKQAVVYAIIQDWLAGLEDRIEAFPLEAHLARGREHTLHEMSKTVTHPTTFPEERKLGRILLGALELYPELKELEAQHTEFCVESAVRFLERAGSQWSKARLRKLARYLLEIRRTIYFTPDDLLSDAIGWQEIATIAVISSCLPPSKK